MQKLMSGKIPTIMAVIVTITALPQLSLAAVQRVKFQSGSNYLIAEFLRDDLVHFELSALGPGPGTDSSVVTTPMVFKTDYPGPSSFARSGPGGTSLDTKDIKLVVDSANLCVTATDKTNNLELTTLCPLNLSQSWKGLTLAPGSMQNVYGLGEQFITPGTADGDWVGRQRTPGDNFGNQMVGFNGCCVGNAQFAVMYALGLGNANYALFLDQVYKQSWDFTGNPWKVETWGDQIRWYLMSGPNLPDLRQDYMELTGHPPVPPKQMFGLWVSEFGFDNWAEIDSKLGKLRTDKFPIDGFVLDLQWFGGVPATGTNPSKMGRLSWDTSNFPDPAARIADYRNKAGIGIMTIEESYVDKGLAEHADLQNREFLVKQCKNGPNSTCDPALACPAAGCPPVFLTHNPWWGRGGMLDWTQDAAGDYWHDQKRQALINDGVIGHWIDLGEPEQYSEQAGQSDWTSGVLPGKHGHADYHNLYNFKWAQSIARGYARHGVARRPFMMARSGAPGIQRFGVSMWSADIGSKLANLAAHQNAQLHMSLSGIDYFGSDIAGFHREAVDSDLNELYTQWFANGMMFDLPGRPHTENLCNCRETAPDRVGDLASNLANVRQRYELSPYLYSLAHRAYLFGEPVVPPLVYYYQSDGAVRKLGNEKLLGRDLLVGIIASPGETQRDIYLPAGDWINYHTHQWFHSAGQTFTAQPAFIDGVFRLPTYARAGAILPKMYVDDKTMNVLGKRTDGSSRNELIVRVYASGTPSNFTLYEDDGETIAYQSGEVRTTVLSQQLAGSSATVTIGAASGGYTGAPASRHNVVELVADNAQATAVTLNGSNLAQFTSRAAFEAAGSGWFNAGGNLILTKSDDTDVSSVKTFVFTLGAAPSISQRFVCDNGTTVPGQSVYAVGSIPRLGNWTPANAVKLDPIAYPRWTKTIADLPPSTRIEWKCIKRRESGDTVDMWQPGGNSVFTSAASGFGGTTSGDFNPSLTVSAQFVCDNGTTVFGQSVYVVGSVPTLGNWAPANAVKLDPIAYPRWLGTISNLPPSTRIEWKCIKRRESGDTVDMWQPGANNVFTSAPSGSGGTTIGDFR